MKIDDIFELWNEDCVIDPSELTLESLKIPKLHNKYYKIYTNEKLVLKKLQEQRKVLYKEKYEYYNGTLDEETLKERGWEPFRKKILKNELDTYIDADQDYINCNLKISVQQEKVDLIESIITNISKRSFNINNAINWEKFKVGL